MIMNINSPFAEIIESSLHSWIAQSWQWDAFPAFGSLVSINSGSRLLFGIVHQVQTGSIDPMHSPFPYKKSQEQLLKDHPQIFEFLKTTLTCVPIGYQEKGVINYLVACEPPKIHAFIELPKKDYAQQFFSSSHYLHVLFSLGNQVSCLDELLLAILHYIDTLGLLSEKKLHDFIETYSLLIGNDYRRLKIFLQRTEKHILIR